VAIIVKWPNHRVTIDNSAHIANGIFIRSERAFPADTEFEAMAKQIYADQVQIYSLLDIMGE
jgi:hypothetical protein